MLCMHFRTFLVEAVVVVLVHGPRHAEVGELDGARRVDEAVPGMGMEGDKST